MEIQPNANANPVRNYNGIDLAKFIGSILIVMIHIPMFSQNGALSFVNAFLHDYIAILAVPIFFLSAGFFLAGKVSKAAAAPSPLLAYAKRILRLYVLWCLLYLPLIAREYAASGKSIIVSIIAYVRIFLFTGGYYQLWFLNALFFAAILIALLLRAGFPLKRILILSAGFYILGLFGQSWFGFIRPLEQLVPPLWKLGALLGKVIITTRNGLFEAFFFVSAGLFLGSQKARLPQIRSGRWFVLSALALALEVTLLNRFGIAREKEMYLFLAPASVFLFLLASGLRLPDRPVYRVLRGMSSLVIFTHLWVAFAVGLLPNRLPSFLHFCLVTLLSMALSRAILLLSEKEKFRFLKKLYA